MTFQLNKRALIYFSTFQFCFKDSYMYLFNDMFDDMVIVFYQTFVGGFPTSGKVFLTYEKKVENKYFGFCLFVCLLYMYLI